MSAPQSNANCSSPSKQPWSTPTVEILSFQNTAKNSDIIEVSSFKTGS